MKKRLTDEQLEKIQKWDKERNELQEQIDALHEKMWRKIDEWYPDITDQQAEIDMDLGCIVTPDELPLGKKIKGMLRDLGIPLREVGNGQQPQGMWKSKYLGLKASIEQAGGKVEELPGGGMLVDLDHLIKRAAMTKEYAATSVRSEVEQIFEELGRYHIKLVKNNGMWELQRFSKNDKSPVLLFPVMIKLLQEKLQESGIKAEWLDEMKGWLVTYPLRTGEEMLTFKHAREAETKFNVLLNTLADHNIHPVWDGKGRWEINVAPKANVVLEGKEDVAFQHLNKRMKQLLEGLAEIGIHCRIGGEDKWIIEPNAPEQLSDPAAQHHHAEKIAAVEELLHRLGLRITYEDDNAGGFVAHLALGKDPKGAGAEYRLEQLENAIMQQFGLQTTWNGNDYRIAVIDSPNGFLSAIKNAGVDYTARTEEGVTKFDVDVTRVPAVAKEKVFRHLIEDLALSLNKSQHLPELRELQKMVRKEGYLLRWDVGDERFVLEKMPTQEEVAQEMP